LLRLLGWLNEEQRTLLLTLLALLASNSIILFFMLHGQDNRAIAYTLLVLLAPLAWVIPELSIALFLIAGSRLIVNAMYYASPLPGTGERTIILLFFFIVSARAVYEWMRTPREERPRLASWLTAILALFWGYYMLHVAYIFIFRYHETRVDNVEAILGYYKPGIIRHFDAHMLWIGVLPLIVVLRDLRRCLRVLTIVGIVVALGIFTLILEYFTPLPEVWKIVFQIRDAGESAEGYRVRDPAVMYLMVIVLFTAIYALGYLRGWRNSLAVLLILASVYGVLITKNRALWAALIAVLPFALFWKPPAVLARQALTLGVTALLLGAGMLHPAFNRAITQKVNEAAERWQRNYIYGGDPRNDPSYQFRLREKEAWEATISRFTLLERFVGRGLEEPYGFYLPLSVKGYPAQRFKNVYFEKINMHFPWLARQTQIGWIGVALLALTLAAGLARIGHAFIVVKHPLTRALLMGVGAGTLAAIGYDAVHSGPLDSPPVLPVILLWSLAELTFHWHRTGQLPEPGGKP